jgi:polar amino acid transport system substrate-binding protein
LGFIIIKTLASFIFLLSSSAFAKTITLGTFKIPQYVRAHDRGEFIELARTIAARSGINLKIVVYPPKRTLQFFQSKKIDGYFPGLDILNKTKVSKTRNYYYKKDFLFFDQKTPISKMEGNSICLTGGYPYAPSIMNAKNVDFHYAGSDDACLEMVKRGRVKGFVCEGLTGVAAIEKLGLAGIKVKQEPLSTLPVYFAFHDNREGQYLAKLFDRELKKMEESGELSKLFTQAKNRVKYYLRSYDPTSR